MILVINAGSSNVKFALFEPENLNLIFKAQVSTIQEVFKWLNKNSNDYLITAVGHRVVHGGMKLFKPILVNNRNLQQLKDLIPLAPLHQPHNVAAIETCLKNYPAIPQVACFDTAFHRTQHELAKLFAIPKFLSNEGIIRYGFHGLSYEYIASIMQTEIGSLSSQKVIVAHLGNGASMCAMQNGKSIATTMGFSVLDGLMMGTRCGSIDPGVLLYLMQQKNYSVEQISELLYYKSGLLGVSGLSNDVKKLLEYDNVDSRHAIDLFCYRAACEFSNMQMALAGCNALIFTGGIGEYAPVVRSKICEYLQWLNVRINHQDNNQNSRVISSNTSSILVAVIPTCEELVIAQHVKALTDYSNGT